MATQTDPGPAPRAPLTRQRVLDAAVELADRDGVGSLSMRKLAQELGVEAMSLYHHVANKDAILDGLIDIVFSEIELPSGQTGWREPCASGPSRPGRRCGAILGDQPDGVAAHPSPRPATPRRRPRHPAQRRLLDRQPPAYFCWTPTSTEFPRETSHRSAPEGRQVAKAIMASRGRHLSASQRDRRRASCSPATTTATVPVQARADPGQPRPGPRRS
jgi:AcrR family transcriptional regulator